MKTLFTILMAFLFLNVYAQEIGSNRTDYSPYGIDYSQLSMQMRLLAHHEDATQITYFDLNFVEELMQDFMRKEMGMTIVNVSKFVKEGKYETFTVTYDQMATMGTTKIPHLYFKYTIFDNKNKNPIIKSLNISGTSYKVIYFYAAYWPTTMNFDGSKNKVAYTYLLQDKATIRLNMTNATWSVSVENEAIKGIDDYENKMSSKSISIPQTPSASNTTTISEDKESINDRLMKEAIIRVANDYNIKFDPKISSDSLRKVILKRKNFLMNGDYYNIVNQVNFPMYDFLKKILSVKSRGFTTDMIIRIDNTGKIYKTEFLPPIPSIYKTVMDKKIIGLKLIPYNPAGEDAGSIKMYNIIKEDRAVHIMEYELSNDSTKITMEKKNFLGIGH